MAIETAVRNTMIAGNYIEQIIGMKAAAQDSPQNASIAGSLVMISDHDKCIIGGSGALFENFVSTGKLESYKGQGKAPSSVNDHDYLESEFRVLPFHMTFPSICKDLTGSEFIFYSNFLYVSLAASKLQFTSMKNVVYFSLIFR